MMAARNRVLVGAAMILGALSIVELTSFALVEGILMKRWGMLFTPSIDPAANLSAAALQVASLEFDNALGWAATPIPAGPSTATRRIAVLGATNKTSGTVLRQTLAELADAQVTDFTTPAYAPDQAILRLERELAAGQRFDAVVLTVGGEDIRPILGTYTPFRISEDPNILGFKPVYERNADGWAWVLPQLERPTDPQAVAAAVEQAAKRDHFFQINAARPRPGISYAISLTKFTAYMLRLKVLGQWQMLPNGGDTEGLWRWAPARQRMAALMERFQRLGAERGFRPVVLFAPSPAQAEAMADGSTAPLEYRVFARDLRRQLGESGLKVVDMLDQIDRRHPLAAIDGRPSAIAAIRAIDGSAACASSLTAANGSAPLSAMTSQNLQSRLEGGELTITATNTDPILFLPRLNAQPRRLDMRVTSPAETSMEVFAITDRAGYGEAPYRVALQPGHNTVSIKLVEDEPLRLRLDPGTKPGTYVIHHLAISGDCPE